MTRGRNLRFSDFASRINYDRLYEEIGWQPIDAHKDEDRGYCLMPENHANGDTTGKLYINRSKGVYHCWVCGGGSLVSLMMETRGLSNQEATALLFQCTDSISKESSEEFYDRIAQMLKDPESTYTAPPFFNERVLEPWQVDHPWFAKRHISPEVRKFFKCGFDPKAKRYHPKFGSYEGPGIILPHYWDGKLIGWQTRWLDSPHHWIPKYTNTSDFRREDTLWGYYFAASQIKPPILVESVPTALMLISEGYPAIATFGSQVTKAQLVHLRAFQMGIMFAPDNDIAGELWLHNCVDYLKDYIQSTRLLKIPPVDGKGADLGDLDPQELATHLRGVRPI